MKACKKYMKIQRQLRRIKYLKENDCPEIVLKNEERILKELSDTDVEKPTFALVKMYVFFEEKIGKSGYSTPFFTTETKVLAFSDSKKHLRKRAKELINSENNQLTDTDFFICNVNDLKSEVADALYGR